jgi:hypothetical protein
MRMSTMFFAVALAPAFPAAAQTPEPPATDVDRYAMSPAEGGFLRLDKQTGKVSFCTVEGGLSVCRLSAEEKAALEADVARLARENAELRAKLSGQKGASSLPSEDEFERTLSFTERFLRRMMKVFREEAPGGQTY